MQKVAEVLLRTFLRRYPLPTRINLFSYLGQYVWLKDVLEELRPELFPPQHDVIEVTADETSLQKPDSSVLGILEQSEIRGRSGYYKAETYLGQRGKGYLFSAIELTSKRSVIIKEFLLPAVTFTKVNARQRQNGFQRLAGIQLADGRLQDFRVIQPFEAIADTESHERCFLVSDFRDGSPTLRQHLQQYGALPLPIVQNVLSQILQTLDFLHNQKFSFPAGAVQNGLVHGNLSLDSILWTEQHAQPFVYLCDLRLWEQWFDPAVTDLQPTQVTSETLQQDLRAVGEIGMTLLQGLDANQPIPIEPNLRQILDSLCTARFDRAETARRALLKLTARSPSALAPFDESTTHTQPSRRLSALLLLSLGALVIGAFVLFPRLRSTEARSFIPNASTCCLAEVSAMPAGNYTYTAVRRGTWWTVLQQRHLLQRGSNLTETLALAQPKLRLQYVPSESLDQVLSQVQSGTADFAVLPLIDDPTALPILSTASSTQITSAIQPTAMEPTRTPLEETDIEPLTITGNTRFSSKELVGVVQRAITVKAEQLSISHSPTVNRSFSPTELLQASEAITQFYVAHGYTNVKVYVPADGLNGATPKIQIVETPFETIDRLSVH